MVVVVLVVGPPVALTRDAEPAQQSSARRLFFGCCQRARCRRWPVPQKSAMATKMKVDTGGKDAVSTYYSSKIEELEVEVREKMLNLRRLEA